MTRNVRRKLDSNSNSNSAAPPEHAPPERAPSPSYPYPPPPPSPSASLPADTCSICFDELSDVGVEAGTVVEWQTCAHKFHCKCADLVLRSTPQLRVPCPLCRTLLDKAPPPPRQRTDDPQKDRDLWVLVSALPLPDMLGYLPKWVPHLIKPVIDMEDYVFLLPQISEVHQILRHEMPLKASWSIYSCVDPSGKSFSPRTKTSTLPIAHLVRREEIVELISVLQEYNVQFADGVCICSDR